MVDGRSENFDTSDLGIFQKICDRKFGIGADGLIIIQEKPGFDFEMLYFNADGSQSMCGNGARCAVAFSSFLGIIAEKANFLAIDGTHKAEIKGDWVELEMLPVKEIKRIGQDYFVDTGSPHHIRFVENLKEYEVVKLGQEIRNDNRLYPKGTNVNFVKTLAGDHIQVRTYERGVEDETLSCGTGVTACALVFGENKQLSKVKITTLGGNLEVKFEKQANGKFQNIILAGPAKRVFSGKIALDRLENLAEEIIVE